ncbi:MAG TPA: glycosyltransferase family 2 protein [Candidatus Acidoferrales bacterium]|nr:glycosyltransferase family 2 protein [Candidatus Acidoferrales bacterium]
MQKNISEPLVSVVIATWNRRDDLRETLKKYCEQTYRKVEIIVVDNGSTDGTDCMLAAEFPAIQYIRLETNTGVKAYNIGMQKALGEIIVVSDNDSYLEATGIQKIVDAFARLGDKVAAIACEVVYVPENKVYNWYRFEHNTQDSEGYSAHMFIGAGAAIKKKVLEEVGYYPEEFFVYMNEVDLSTRIIGAGYDIRYFPNIVTYHNASTVSRSKGRIRLLSYRNIIWYYWKYFPFPIALGRCAIRVPVEIAQLLLTGTNPMWILSSTVETIKGIPGIIRNRKPIPKRFVKKALGYQTEIGNLASYYKEEVARRFFQPRANESNLQNTIK